MLFSTLTVKKKQQQQQQQQQQQRGKTLRLCPTQLM
jgi:hypothetical protein